MVGNADAVNALLAAGAHPDESGTNGGRPIVAAVSGEGTFAGGGNAPSSSDSSVFVATDSPLRAEIVKALLARGVNPNEALRPACEKGNVAAVRTLLDGGAKPDGDPSEASPLSTAAFFGQDAVAKLLIERGADVNDGGHLDAQTAGMMVFAVPAASSGGSSRYSAWPYPLVVETSSGTSDGSSVNAPPVVVPPLVAAAVGGNATIVAQLLAAGADPNRTATGGWSPLWAAVFAGDEPSLHLLLAAHAVDAPPSDPTSATLLADRLNEPRMVWFITSGS
jgi:ankyrin repeat protein